MSPTISNVLSNGAAPTSSKNTTASWTPDGTSQAILTVSGYASSGTANPVISSVVGNGLTWTQVALALGDDTGTDQTSQYVFVAPAGGTAGTIVITYSTSPTRASWTLDKVANADPAFGSGTLPQLAKTGVSSGANPTAGALSALQPGSVTYGSVDWESSAGTLAAGTGFTSLASVTSQSLAWCMSAWSSSGALTFAPTNTTTSNRHSCAIIEVPAIVVANANTSMFMEFF